MDDQQAIVWQRTHELRAAAQAELREAYQAAGEASGQHFVPVRPTSAEPDPTAWDAPMVTAPFPVHGRAVRNAGARRRLAEQVSSGQQHD